MKTRLIYTASLTALAAGLLFACGNGDDDDTNTATDSGTPDSSTTAKQDASTTSTPDAATTADAAPGADAAPATDSGTPADSGTPDTGAPAPLDPTFTNVYATIISTTCASCHGTATGEGAVGGDLLMDTKQDSFTALVNTAAAGEACGTSGEKRVVPSSSATSLLWQKVNGTQTCGSRMPLGGQLEQAQIDLIAAWINAGAQNN